MEKIESILKALAKTGVAIGIAAVIQIGANSLAYQERGYEAVGGEVLAFPVTLAVEYSVFLQGEKDAGIRVRKREYTDAD